MYLTEGGGQSFQVLWLFMTSGVMTTGCCVGCSKTRMAQAAAGSSGMRLQPLSGAQLFSMYVGEGEGLLRDAFQRARLTAPAIIFIDEIDAIVGAEHRMENIDIHACFC